MTLFLLKGLDDVEVGRESDSRELINTGQKQSRDLAVTPFPSIPSFVVFSNSRERRDDHRRSELQFSRAISPKRRRVAALQNERCAQKCWALRNEAAYYFPTTTTANESGFIVRCGRPPGVEEGVSMTSAAGRKIFRVFGSNAIVLAVGCVLTAPAST